MLPLVLLMLKRTLPWPTKCNELVLRSKGRSHITVHRVFSHAGNAENECADIAASLGMKGFVSEPFWKHGTKMTNTARL